MFGFVAVVTASGKAYYRLANELKREGVPFLSLKPGETIPPSVKVVITTSGEKNRVHFPKVLVYDDKDPVSSVEKALQLLSGKSIYDQIVIGVDPGKTFGIVVVGDGNVLRSMSAFDAREAAQKILLALNTMNAHRKKIRIGDGAKEYQLKLVKLLDGKLPPEITLESVNEKGTTKTHGALLMKYPHAPRDIRSAIRISMRRGHEIRREGHEQARGKK